MRKLSIFIFSGVLLTFAVGCSPKLSPGIAFNNMSNQSIYHLTCDWNDHWVKGVPELWPGQGASTHIWIKKRSDYFGEVVLKWKNSAGENFVERIEVNEETFPLLRKDFEDIFEFAFYFTQKGVDYYVKTTGAVTDETFRRVKLMRKYRLEYKKRKRENSQN